MCPLPGVRSPERWGQPTPSSPLGWAAAVPLRGGSGTTRTPRAFGTGRLTVSESDETNDGSSLLLFEQRSNQAIHTARRRAFLPSIVAALVAAAVFIGVGVNLGSAVAVLLATVGTIFIAATTLSLLGTGVLSWRTRPTLTTSDTGIQVAIEGHPTRRIPFESVALAWKTQPNRVHLFDYQGGGYRLSFSDERAATDLVEKVRARQSRRSYQLSLDGPTHTVVGGALLGLCAFYASLVSLVALGPIGLIPGLIPPAGFFLLAARILFIRRAIRFGADGIALEAGHITRFVPYRAIERVYPSAGDGVVSPLYLRLREGEWVRVPGLRAAGQTDMLAALISEGLGMHERGEKDGAQVADLVRGRESTSEWRKRLGGLVRGRYRGATLSSDKLATLMRNPAAKPDQRAAAALALLREPGSRPRIRVAAEVSADPHVKAAFEELAASDGDDLDDTAVEKLISRIS